MPQSPVDDTNFGLDALAHLGVISSLFDRVIDRCNTDLRKSEAPGNVHSGHDVLMSGIRIGADGQRHVVFPDRYFLQRITNCLRAIVDEFAAVNKERTRLSDHNVDLLRRLFDQSRALGLGQADVDL